MKLKHYIYSLILVLGFSTVASCKHQTCPTYATSGPTKRKKTRRAKKNAPWHKSKTMKKGKGVGVSPK